MISVDGPYLVMYWNLSNLNVIILVIFIAVTILVSLF